MIDIRTKSSWICLVIGKWAEILQRKIDAMSLEAVIDRC